MTTRELRDEHKVFDHYFMNHAYLSEKWLQEYLMSFKELAPKEWTVTFQRQLDDETRHMRICRACLMREGIRPVEDMRYSIQRALYTDVGGVSFPAPTTRSVVEQTAFAIERRAALIYKLYLRYGTVPRYRRAIQTILADEERHKHDVFNPNGESIELKAAEDHAFKNVLPQKYGRSFTGSMTFTNLKFWQELFGENN